MGPCAKARVVCTIVTPDGRRFVGTNDVDRPQRVCPRGPDSYRGDYELCALVCRQTGHAEQVALANARKWAVGATAYVEHHRVCDDCHRMLTKAGIQEIKLGPPPERWDVT